MTPRTPQVGDTITTAEELDALPLGTVVLDAFGKACQRLADDGDVLRWWRCGHHLPNRAHLPAIVLHLDDSPRPPRPEREFVIDAPHLARQQSWSRRTFGPGERTAGVIAHIRKELLEVEAAPTDPVEWADVIILAFDGAWRAGIGPQVILDAIRDKQARNERRTWPDWRTADPDKPIEHDRIERGEV